jgi:hypothetical protein
MKAISTIKTLGILTFLTAIPALTSIANIGSSNAAMAQEFRRGERISERRNSWCERKLDNLRSELIFLRERRERRLYQGRPTYEIDNRIQRVRDERRDLRDRCNNVRNANW